MYPNQFDYYRAGSVQEALDLLSEHAERETELLAGGHSLLPTMKTGLASPDVLIDIGNIESLQGIDAHGDTLSIGAMSTYADVANSEAAREAAPAFTAAAAAVGDVQVRNVGTVGGNIAHADPASDLPGAAIASNASFVLEGPDGERKVEADDFFLGMYATDVGPDEILTQVTIPTADGATGTYAKKPSPASGYAMVGVAGLLETDGGTINSASVGANGVMDHGVRLDPVEDALEGRSLSDDVIADAASRATEGLDETMMMEDIQATAEFRAQLLGVYTERALREAADGARSPAAADD